MQANQPIGAESNRHEPRMFVQTVPFADWPTEASGVMETAEGAPEDPKDGEAVAPNVKHEIQEPMRNENGEHGSESLLTYVLSRTRQHTCGKRRCADSRHLTKTASGRFWAIEYSPLSAFLEENKTRRCSSTWLRFQLRVALSQYRIPWAIILGLDFQLAGGVLSLQPALQAQIIVPYTSPGFELIWRCQNWMLSVEDTCTALIEMSRSDPSWKNHRDPMGRSYIQVKPRI
jgi:hypothetical protein